MSVVLVTSVHVWSFLFENDVSFKAIKKFMFSHRCQQSQLDVHNKSSTLLLIEIAQILENYSLVLTHKTTGRQLTKLNITTL